MFMLVCCVYAYIKGGESLPKVWGGGETCAKRGKLEHNLVNEVPK